MTTACPLARAQDSIVFNSSRRSAAIRAEHVAHVQTRLHVTSPENFAKVPAAPCSRNNRTSSKLTVRHLEIDDARLSSWPTSSREAFTRSALSESRRDSFRSISVGVRTLFTLLTRARADTCRGSSATQPSGAAPTPKAPAGAEAEAACAAERAGVFIGVPRDYPPGNDPPAGLNIAAKCAICKA